MDVQIGAVGPRSAIHCVSTPRPRSFSTLTPQGKPRIFVSHGRHDPVLPFTGAAAIVDALRGDGYDVAFVPFEGGHELPSGVARGALDWFVE